jgi:hypothetical protein
VRYRHFQRAKFRLIFKDSISTLYMTDFELYSNKEISAHLVFSHPSALTSRPEQEYSVRTEKMPLAGQQKNRSLFPGRDKNLSLHQSIETTGSGAHPVGIGNFLSADTAAGA